ncbi:MAG: hypothetical protein ACREBR_02935, partial [bacterium]
KCSDCIAETNKGNLLGCRPHQGSPMVWRKGNPTSTELVGNEAKISKRAAFDYRSKDDAALTPWDMFSIRSALLSQNDVINLQTYVMLLLSTKLFLRSAEVINLTVDKIRLQQSKGL